MAVVYLAGPEVFLPDAKDVGESKIAICRERGLDARFPLMPDDHPVSKGRSPSERGHEIFAFCVSLMDECDVLIANMTPFRGASMDVGTAVEMAYMFARGHRVFGYTNVAADYAARVTGDALIVESFGFADNLMCEGLVWRSGGSVVRHDAPSDARFTDLRGFAECVEQALRYAD